MRSRGLRLTEGFGIGDKEARGAPVLAPLQAPRDPSQDDGNNPGPALQCRAKVINLDVAATPLDVDTDMDSFSTRWSKSLLWRWLASLFQSVHSRLIAFEVEAALVVDFGICMFTAGFAGVFCVSRCIPFDFRQAQVARHHDRFGPDGQLLRWRQLECRGGQCSQESGTFGCLTAGADLGWFLRGSLC